MRGHADLNLYGMAQAAVRRSTGHCEAFCSEHAADEDVLTFPRRPVRFFIPQFQGCFGSLLLHQLWCHSNKFQILETKATCGKGHLLLTVGGIEAKMQKPWQRRKKQEWLIFDIDDDRTSAKLASTSNNSRLFICSSLAKDLEIISSALTYFSV
uniref:Uncharacterized protein n=1 Tax=Oryza glumipatula TaxID=40148 RepID=A0A0E0ARU8_9ORYZ